VEPTDSRNSERWARRLNYLAGACVSSSMSAAVTYVPLYMKSLGSSYFVSGLPLGVRAIGRFTFDAAAIVVAGRGVRPQTILALGVTFTGLALLACALFPGAYPVTAAFFFIGAGVAWVQIALRQIVFEGAQAGRRGRALGILSRPRAGGGGSRCWAGRRGRALGILSLFLASGPMVGIALGGFVSEHLGYRTLFAVGAGFVLWLPLLLVRLTPREKKPKGREGSLHGRVIREILCTPGAGLLCAASFFSLFYQPARALALAFYATDSLGLSLSSYGIMRGISQLGNVNGRFFGGLWTDRSGVGACLATGFFISAAGYALVPWTTDFWSLLVVHTAVGAGAGMVNLAGQVGILSLFPSAMRGQAMALHRAVGDVGLFLGPMVVTAGLDAFGFYPVFMGLAAPPLVFGLWTVLGRSLPRADAVPDG